jgi:DHA1 family inner membrane transport protein
MLRSALSDPILIASIASRKVLVMNGQHGIAFATLGLGAVVVGASELVVVGILDPIADDAGVSIGTAGMLVTVYALGIAVGGPIATARTAGFDRCRFLRVALAVYVAANVLTAVTASCGLLVVSRAATGTVHGIFIGVATVVAAALAEGHSRSRSPRRSCPGWRRVAAAGCATKPGRRGPSRCWRPWASAI